MSEVFPVEGEIKWGDCVFEAGLKHGTMALPGYQEEQIKYGKGLSTSHVQQVTDLRGLHSSSRQHPHPAPGHLQMKSLIAGRGCYQVVP